jgi:hypothetical protein
MSGAECENLERSRPFPKERRQLKNGNQWRILYYLDRRNHPKATTTAREPSECRCCHSQTRRRYPDELRTCCGPHHDSAEHAGAFLALSPPPPAGGAENESWSISESLGMTWAARDGTRRSSHAQVPGAGPAEASFARIRSWRLRRASMIGLMPSPTIPKTCVAPQSIKVSIRMSEVLTS